METYAGPAAALRGEGFTPVTREHPEGEVMSVVTRWVRARTNVVLTVTVPATDRRWTAVVTGTRATTPVTIEGDLTALTRRITR